MTSLPFCAVLLLDESVIPQSDDAKLALLSELPVFLPREAVASLVSGTGKTAFSDLLDRIKNILVM